MLVDVVLIVLRKTVNEYGPRNRPEYNNRSEPSRLPHAGTRNTLLNHSTSEIGRNQSSFSVPYRLAQHVVAYAELLRETVERLVLKYMHRVLPNALRLQGKYNT